VCVYVCACTCACVYVCVCVYVYTQDQYPGWVVFHNGYSKQLEHILIAAADMLLMPSRHEPCGLPQVGKRALYF